MPTQVPAFAEKLLNAETATQTKALVRKVELPGGGGIAALITLENGHDHTKPTLFGPSGLKALD